MLWLPLLPPPPQSSSSFLSTTTLPFSLIQYINSSFHCSTLYFRQLYSPCQLTRWDVIDRTIYSGGIFQLSHLHHYYLLLLLLLVRCEFRTISRENDIQLLSQRERMNFAFAISPSSKLNLKYLDRSFDLFFFLAVCTSYMGIRVCVAHIVVAVIIIIVIFHVTVYSIFVSLSRACSILIYTWHLACALTLTHSLAHSFARSLAHFLVSSIS